jgi:hypothetical protein
VRLLLVSPALPSASVLRRVADLLFLAIAADSPAFVKLAARVAEELSFLPHNHERRPQIQVDIVGHLCFPVGKPLSYCFTQSAFRNAWGHNSQVEIFGHFAVLLDQLLPHANTILPHIHSILKSF